MTARYRRSYNCLISMAVSAVIALIVLLATGIMTSGATLGSDREYDLIRYIGGVIERSNSIRYSFSGSAGEGIFYRISEIMFSPLNLILAMTPRTSFEQIYNILVIVKTALASCSCAAFINYRFFTTDNNKFIKFDIRHIAVIIAAVFYSLSGISMEGGLFPADGMIFLPLILMGVYKISIDKGAQTFVIAALLNLLCNWYSGLINIFCGFIWILMEILIQAFSSDGFVKSGDLVQISVRGIRFFISAVLSIGSGAILWYTSLKVLPESTSEFVSFMSQNVPGYFMSGLGAVALVCFLVLNNCGYKIKITVFTGIGIITALALTGIMGKIVTGGGYVDPQTHPIRHIIAMECVFLFCLTFIVKNNFSKKQYVRLIFSSVALVLMIVHIVVMVVIPMNAKGKEPHEPYYIKADLTNTLIEAVRSIDEGAYRIGFVSDDLQEITLVASCDDNIYFEDGANNIQGNGDVIASCYPYAVKYFVSRADLGEISGGNEPLGELEGYKVYLNSYFVPVAFIYDGSYFDAAFKSLDAEERLLMAKDTVRRTPTGVSFKSDDIKFTATAHEGEEMFVSVPANDRFDIELNGIRIVPKNYSGTFYSITMKEGVNVVTLTYSPDHVSIVLLVSVISFIVLILFVFIENFYDMHYPER